LWEFEANRLGKSFSLLTGAILIASGRAPKIERILSILFSLLCYLIRPFQENRPPKYSGFLRKKYLVWKVLNFGTT